jgi:hypothetical protein
MKKTIDINYKLKITSGSTQNNLMLWLSKPINVSGQVMESFQVNPEPKNSYRYRDNVVLFFDETLTKTKPFVLETRWRVHLSKQEALPKKTSFGDSGIQDYETYTKSEQYLEVTNEITSLTETVVEGTKNNIEKILKIFNYVVVNFTYEYPVQKRGVKNLNLKAPRGDCAEYSSLFVAMCRSIGIMARNVTGFVIFDKEKSIVEHGWSQVYTNEAGWVDVDTQYAALENSIETGIKKYFLNRIEYRLITCIGFNILLEPNVPDNYSIEDCTNKLSLEMKKSVVQTLQPIAFAVLSKVSFNDSISVQ